MVKSLRQKGELENNCQYISTLALNIENHSDLSCIQVTGYILDHQRIFEARYNFNRTTALPTGIYFYSKTPFKSLRPRY